MKDAEVPAVRRLIESGQVRRFGIYAVALIVAFLLGLIPMWMTARERGLQRDEAQRSLRLSQFQNLIAFAAISARRGDYEPARQKASEFFSNVRAEIDKGNKSVFTQAQRDRITAVLSQRDELITLLARSDPASAERLAELYLSYRRAGE
jgi:hypothetical protein